MPETELKSPETPSTVLENGAPAAAPSLDFETSSGIPVKRLYTEEDVPFETLQNAGAPGQFPFTRGLYPNGYREKLWTMRMYSGFGSAKETNKRFHYLISHGETGLSLAFDLPTQIGYDPGDPAAKGEVGKVGVSISGIWDFEKLLDGIDLSKVSLSMTINSTAFILYALYYVMAKKRGVDPKTLRGTVQNDILKEFIARGTQSYPLNHSMRVVTDLIDFSLKNTPQFYPISVSGYHIREAGSTAVDEIAFTLADALAYLEALKARGVDIAQALPRLSFFFGVHNSMVEEVSKFRAARQVWATLLKERWNIQEPKQLHLRFHAQTCGSTLVKEEPVNNAVRVALQALYAVLGGCQSLHTNSFDEALSIPSEEAHLLALRTQQLLACETGVPDCADPLGGSYAIETMTKELAARIRQRLDEIQTIGGMVEAVKKGFPQRALEEAAYKAQRDIETGKATVVGVNTLKAETSAKAQVFKVKATVEKEAIKQLAAEKKKRNAASVKKCLENLRKAAKTSENLMPYTIEAIENRATLGEIASVLREEFGGA